MCISATVLLTLGGTLAKWLAKRFFGDEGPDFASDLIDLAKDKVSDVIERRKAARDFEGYSDAILQKLQESIGNRRKRHPELDADAVFGELSKTLAAGVTDHFLIARDLDPLVIDEDLQQRRSLPDGALPELETRVYREVLQEVVRYLIEVASVLPKFETALATQTLRRLSNLGQDVEQVLQTVQRIETRVVEPGARDDARFEADYRAALIRGLDRVDLFGADIPPENQRNLLTEAFVTLNVDRDWESSRSQVSPKSGTTQKQQPAAEPLSDSEAASADEPVSEKPACSSAGSLITCNELFDSLEPGASCILIRGSAGCGKTTLLRWAAIEAAGCDGNLRIAGVRSTPEDPPVMFVLPHKLGNWLRLIPFFIPLRHCQSGKLPEPDELPLLIAKEVGRPRQNWVREVLNDGRAIVLLDGVDEVPEQNRATLRDEIKAIIEAYPKCYFVLSSRPTAVQGEWDGWLKKLNFRCADISPMSMPDVKRFVEKWHDATAKELSRQGKPDGELAKTARRLIEQFEQNPPLSLLATNPLLCAMICALHRVRNQKLPESQYQLCNTLCEMLLHRRERESDLNWEVFPDEYTALSYEQKRGIAQQLAQYMMHNGESAMPIEAAYEQVAGALQKTPGRNADEAPLILKTLIERSGLLREPNPDVVDFLHNTFKELLAGDDVAARGDMASVVEHLNDEAWRRVGLFAVASPRSQTFAGGLIARLLERCEQTLAARARPRQKAGQIKAAKQPKVGRTSSPSSPDRDGLEVRPTVTALDPKNLKTACRKDKELLTTVLFILQCRRVAAFLDPPHVSAQVDRLVNVPYPPADFESAEAIARLGDTAIKPLVKARLRTPKQEAATARALRLINSQASRTILRNKFIDSHDWDVIGELAQTMNPLEIPIVVSLIQSKFGSSGLIPEAVSELIDDLTPLTDRTDIRHLDLSGTRISDITALVQFTNLEDLDLSGTLVDDISPVATLKNLTSLSLEGAGSGDLSPLTALTKLRELRLHSLEIRDLSPLSTLKGLTRLHVTRANVDDLTPLSYLQELQVLGLSGVTAKDLTPLKRLVNIEVLDLTGSKSNDLSPLSNLRNLKVLYLRGADVVDLSPLAELRMLKYLYLAGSAVTDVSPLKHHDQLKIHGFPTFARPDVPSQATDSHG